MEWECQIKICVFRNEFLLTETLEEKQEVSLHLQFLPNLNTQ